MCTQLHFNISKEIGVKSEDEHWCGHVPESSHESKINILYKQQVKLAKLWA